MKIELKELYDTALLNTARSPRDVLAYKRALWLQSAHGAAAVADPLANVPLSHPVVTRRELLSLLQEALLSFHTRHWTGSFNVLVFVINFLLLPFST